MTISTTTSVIAYSGNGSTTVFAVPFAFFNSTDLEVIERVSATGAETTKALTTDYTVSGGGGAVGTVTALVAPATTVTWTIRRTTAATQTSALPSNGPFPSATVERALDKAAAETQEDRREFARALVVPKTESGLTLPNSVARANKTLFFDSSGNATVADLPGAGTSLTGDASLATVKATGSTTARTLAERFAQTFHVKDYGAVGDGLTNDATAIQAAITAASIAGGRVIFDAKTYRLTTALTMASSFVSLEGQGPQSTSLTFANGSADCINIGSAGAASRSQSIRGLGIFGSSKTGGYATVWRNAYNCTLEDVQIEGVLGGADVGPSMNNLTLRRVRMTLTAIASPTGIKFWAAGDGSNRADALWLYDVVISGDYTGTGVLWDGMANTMGGSGLIILKFAKNFNVKNTAASGSYYPQYGNLHNCEFEGAATNSLHIEGGNDFKFSDTDVTNNYGASGQGSADNEAILISADAGASITRGVQFTGLKVGLTRTNAIRCDARDCQFANVIGQSSSQAGSAAHAVIRLGATAQNIEIANLRAEEYGGAALASYAIQLDAGASYVIGANIDARFTVTGNVLDNSGNTTNRFWNIVGRDGTVFNGGSMLIFDSINSAIEGRVQNNSTGGSAIARYTLATGVANASASLELQNASGTPRFSVTVGAGTTGGIVFGTANGTALSLSATGTAVNYLNVVGAATGAPVVLSPSGDANAGVTIDAAGTGNILIGTATTKKVGFYGATPTAKLTVTGSRGANAALTSLLTQLATLGLITDSSS